MKAAVEIQPVTAMVDASKRAWTHYKQGLLTSKKCGTDVNHAVLIVGYGVDSLTNLQYWLVKNS